MINDRSAIYKAPDLESIINHENSSAAFCYDFISDGARVLDAGCACGDLGMALNKYKNCDMYGLEYNDGSANIAKATGAYRDVKKCDLDNFNPADLCEFGKFDFIVLGDVLEHLRDPYVALEKLKTLLAQNGALVISIPNVAHASIKSALLFGRFDYADVGLLDRTHIHFFTYKTILEMLDYAGLKLEDCRPTFCDLIHTNKINPWFHIPYFTRRFIMSDFHSFVCQYVIIARVGSTENNADKFKFNKKSYKRFITDDRKFYSPLYKMKYRMKILIYKILGRQSKVEKYEQLLGIKKRNICI